MIRLKYKALNSTLPLSLSALLLATSICAQAPAVQEKIMADITYLASDELEGREPGTMGEIKASNYIAERFEEIGLSPKGTDGFFQVFRYNSSVNPHGAAATNAKPTSARNVIGYIDNGAEHTVAIGAHYDHLGYGGFGSLYTGEPAIHNGADDNASGVAMMISLAEWLNNSKLKKNNYLFIAFSGEEAGLMGSNYFVKNATVPIHTINYMINMDMVGRLREDNSLSVSATGTSPEWENSLNANNTDSLALVFDKSGHGPSDFSSFCNKGIPALSFFTGQHSDYHKPSDDVEHINPEGIMLIYSLIQRIITDKNDEGKLSFLNTQAPEKPGRSSFTVTLGVMPDYLYDGQGMRLDGILGGRVAEKYGIESGDIIIKMGKMDVEDVYGYMEALGTYQKGDKAKVTLLRNGKKVKKKVVFE